MDASNQNPSKSRPQSGAHPLSYLPFVVGVMADLRGSGARPPLKTRAFIDIDIDNFDLRMAAEGPRVAFQVPDTLTGEGSLCVDITFKALSDFSPAAVALAVGPLSSLLRARALLANLLSFIDGMSGPEELASQLLGDPGALQSLANEPIAEPPLTQSGGATPLDDPFRRSGTYFDRMLTVLRMGDHTRSSIRTGIRESLSALAQQALSNPDLIVSDPVNTINSIIARIDQRLSRQINLILHHPEFQALEGTWRGLALLVNQVPPDNYIRIRILNLTKQELAQEARKHRRGGWSGSWLAKVVQAESTTPHRVPFGLLVGDLDFGPKPEDVEVLEGMAMIARASHAPFIAGASPSLVGLKSWSEIHNAVRRFVSPEHIRWHAFRESEDSRFLGLVMPRILARLPYVIDSNDFPFKEEVDEDDSSTCCWSNAAFVMAAVVARAFTRDGWGANIWGHAGGLVKYLYSHGQMTSCFPRLGPTEVAVDDRRLSELARSGLLPLLNVPGGGQAYFGTDQSCHKAAEYEDPDADAHAKGAERLNRTLIVSRFALLLLQAARYNPSCPKEAGPMEQWLNSWLNQFVASNPSGRREARNFLPLDAACVYVENDPGPPGHRRLMLHMKVRNPDRGLSFAARTVVRLEDTQGR